LYELISSTVNATVNMKPCSSAAHVCMNEVQLTFKRTASLRLSAEESLASMGVIREEGPFSEGCYKGYCG
jgi:hypothetical protein